MKVSIVIPAYNEEKRITPTLEAFTDYFAEKIKLRDFDYEILIVINNTKDKTEEIVKQFQRKNKRILYLNLKKGGKGYAVTEGFKDALKRNNDLIGFVDADLATPPSAFFDLIKKIGSSDGVLASRYVPGANITPKFSFRRLVVSRVFNFIVRTLFFMPYRDTQCGAKLFTRNSLAKTVPKLGMTQWAFDIELLYEMRKLGFSIKEIPTQWKEIEGSNVNIRKTSFQMLLSVIQLRIIKWHMRRLLKPFKPVIMRLWKNFY